MRVTLSLAIVLAVGVICLPAMAQTETDLNLTQRLSRHIHAAQPHVSPGNAAYAGISLSELGELAALAGEHDVAIQLLQRIEAIRSQATSDHEIASLNQYAARVLIALRNMETVAEMARQMDAGTQRALCFHALHAQGVTAARDLARQVAPASNTRALLYADMAIDLAQRGRPDQAWNFIDAYMDLASFAEKIPAMSVVAIQWHRQGQAGYAKFITNQIETGLPTLNGTGLLQAQHQAIAARALLLTGDPQRANQLLAEAVEILGGHTPPAFGYDEAAVALIDTLAAAGDVQACLKWLPHIVRHQMKTQANHAIIKACLRLGQLDQAREHLQAHQMAPSDLGKARIDVHLEAGDVDGAIRTLEQIDDHQAIRHGVQAIAHALTRQKRLADFDRWAGQYQDQNHLQWPLHMGAAAGLLEAINQ